MVVQREFSAVWFENSVQRLVSSQEWWHENNDLLGAYKTLTWSLGLIVKLVLQYENFTPITYILITPIYLLICFVCQTLVLVIDMVIKICSCKWVSVLNDALKSMYNAKKRGKHQVMIRPSSKVIIKFLISLCLLGLEFCSYLVIRFEYFELLLFLFLNLKCYVKIEFVVLCIACFQCDCRCICIGISAQWMVKESLNFTICGIESKNVSWWVSEWVAGSW